MTSTATKLTALHTIPLTSEGALPWKNAINFCARMTPAADAAAASTFSNAGKNLSIREAPCKGKSGAEVRHPESYSVPTSFARCFAIWAAAVTSPYKSVGFGTRGGWPLAVHEHRLDLGVGTVLEAGRVVGQVARGQLVTIRQGDEVGIAGQELGHVG